MLLSPRLLPAVLLVLLGLPAGAAAQIVDPGSDPPRNVGGGRYSGPRDTVPPPGSNTTEAEDEATAPVSPPRPEIVAPFTPITITGGSVTQPARQPQAVRPPPEDDSGWLPWWRYQRWQRFEPTPLSSEPPLAVTPGSGEVRGLKAPPPKAPAADEVLEALRGAWKEAPEEADVRAALLIALARVGTGATVGEALRAGLVDEDQRVIEAAALGLGILREPHAIGVLSGLVRDDPETARSISRTRIPLRTRAFAAYALGLVAEQSPYAPIRHSIREALWDGLADRQASRPDLAAACVAALGLFPAEDAEEIVPDLLAVLREKGRQRLTRAQVPIAVAKLLARRGRADALCRSTFDNFVKRLELAKDSSELRQSCALALGRLGTLHPLAEGAAIALAETASRDADPKVRRLAYISLAEIAAAGSPAGMTHALPLLFDSVEDGTDVDRSWAALGLGWCAARAQDGRRPLPARFFDKLQSAYPETANMRLRAAVSLAIGLAGHAPGADTVAAGLDGMGDPRLRGEAVAGLALLGQPDHFETVWTELQTIDVFTEGYQSICSALAHSHPDELHDRLLEGLDSTGTRLKNRYSAALALGWYRDERAVEPLLQLITRDDPFFVRMAAVTSLGRVAERPGRRWNAGYLDLLNPYAATETMIGDPTRFGVCDRL